MLGLIIGEFSYSNDLVAAAWILRPVIAEAPGNKLKETEVAWRGFNSYRDKPITTLPACRTEGQRFWRRYPVRPTDGENQILVNTLVTKKKRSHRTLPFDDKTPVRGQGLGRPDSKRLPKILDRAAYD